MSPVVVGDQITVTVHSINNAELVARLRALESIGRPKGWDA
jgi:hypothetical protein